MKNLFKFVGFLNLVIPVVISAQIGQGGSPISFQLDVRKIEDAEIQKVVLQKPNLDQLALEDTENDALGKAYRVGQLIGVNLNPQNSGTWKTMSDGSKLWRLKIQAEDALALGLYFSEDVILPQGTKLFAYSKNQKHVLGAYTSETPRFQAMQMVAGDQITLEYHAPSFVFENPVIAINEVSYFYRGVEDFVAPFSSEPSLNTRAQSCQVDVACSPENTGWADQIRSVVHYTFNQGGFSFVCSAATINNTAADCKPYILTAWHCGERTAGSSISSWVWYWNYQKTTCQPNANSVNPSKGNQTMTGGTVRASSGNGNLNNPPSTNQVAGSDFYLVELSSSIPSSYNPYFAGWDRNSSGATSGVSIHHPAGSAKKISTFTTTLQNASFNGGAPGHFWAVTWAATANGHGVTEGGSSGSPIFNQNKRIVGQLTGGLSACNATGENDVYGKFRSDWSLNSNSANASLQSWLDPTNSGVSVLDGHFCSVAPSNYCTSTSANTCASQSEYIANVTLNTIDNDSGCDDYSNFTNISTTLPKGSSQSISISTALVGSTSLAFEGNQIAAWIDYNQNGTFEASERLGITTVGASTSFPIQYNFNVPANAVSGATRMRVRLNYQPDDGNIEPCNPSSGPYDWGETEDYTINITAAANLDEEEMLQFSVYPNPNSGELKIASPTSMSSNYEVKIYDLNGKLVAEFSDLAPGTQSLDIENLAHGVYQMMILDAGKFTSIRLVKQ